MARDAGIDAARGIGIAAVVLGHSWSVLHDKGEAFRVLFSFHMPLFFVLAGMFLRGRQPVGRVVRSRADALLKPYVVTLLGLGLYRLVEGLLHDGQVPASTSRFFAAILIANGRHLEWFAHWFLPQLFLASLLAWGVLRLAGEPRVQGLAAAGLLAAGVALLDAGDRSPWPWSIDLLPVSTALVLAGACGGPLLRRAAADGRLASLALAGFVALHLAFDATIDLNLRRYDGALLATAQALCGIVAVLAAGARVVAWPLAGPAFRQLGEASLFVLLFHVGVHKAVTGWLLAAGMAPRGAVDAVSVAAALVLPVVLWRLAWRRRLVAALLLPRPRAPGA